VTKVTPRWLIIIRSGDSSAAQTLARRACSRAVSDVVKASCFSTLCCASAASGVPDQSPAGTGFRCTASSDDNTTSSPSLGANRTECDVSATAVTDSQLLEDTRRARVRFVALVGFVWVSFRIAV
jgi:hypothetical protein